MCWEYAYDSAGHLQSVFYNGAAVEAYRYNKLGQRDQDRLAYMGGRRFFTYNGQGQLVAVTGERMNAHAGITFVYDAYGSLHKKTQNNATTTYSYGTDTRLDTVVLPNRDEVRYEYGTNLLPSKIYVNNELIGMYVWRKHLQLQTYYDARTHKEYTFHYSIKPAKDEKERDKGGESQPAQLLLNRGKVSNTPPNHSVHTIKGSGNTSSGRALLSKPAGSEELFSKTYVDVLCTSGSLANSTLQGVTIRYWQEQPVVKTHRSQKLPPGFAGASMDMVLANLEAEKGTPVRLKNFIKLLLIQ